MPCSEKIAPRESLTAMTCAPASVKSWAAIDPALPKPWMTTRAFAIDETPGTAPDAIARWVTKRQPRAVASRRPSEPPIGTGLPVTTGRLFWPGCIIAYVS